MRGIERSDMYYSFKRGSLAGLTPEQRAEAQRKQLGNHFARLMSGKTQEGPCGYEEWRCEPKKSEEGFAFMLAGNNLAFPHEGATLEECLESSTCDALRNTLRSLNVRHSSGLRKAELVALVLQELQKSGRCLTALLSIASDEVLDLFVRAIAAGDEGVQVEGSVRRYGAFSTTIPHLFWSKGHSSISAYVPPELRALISSEEQDRIVQERRAALDVKRLLSNTLLLCGTLSLTEAYACYCKTSSEHSLSEEEFRSFAQKVCHTSRFIHFLRGSEETLICTPSVPTGNGVFSGRIACFGNKGAFSVTALEAAHEQVASRFLAECMCDVDVEDYVYGLSSVRKLTAYFDEHVPRKEDEYYFADLMVDKLLNMMIFKNCSLTSVLRFLTHQGWFLAEGSTRAPRLTQLVCETYRTIPRWELNGWSEREFEDIVNVPELISADVHYACDELLAS